MYYICQTNTNDNVQQVYVYNTLNYTRQRTRTRATPLRANVIMSVKCELP